MFLIYEYLNDLFGVADCGELQLPDFQRGWVWDDYGIRSLLASISQYFLIGAIMMLRVGGKASFQPRLIEGVKPEGATALFERLVLDG